MNPTQDHRRSQENRDCGHSVGECPLVQHGGEWSGDRSRLPDGHSRKNSLASPGNFVCECPSSGEVAEQLRRAIMPPGWILLQQPQNKVFERRRDIVLMRREQFGLIVKNRVRNRDLLITTEWLSAREHLVEHDAECP